MPSIPNALVSMLLRLPNIKFVVVTLGDKGCIMLERSIDGKSNIKLCCLLRTANMKAIYGIGLIRT